MSEYRLTIDRFEEQHAVVLVDGTHYFEIPRWMLPDHTTADDVVAASVAAEADRMVITLRRDPDATRRANAAARDAVQRLTRRDGGGKIDL